jgi:hypothetical protein
MPNVTFVIHSDSTSIHFNLGRGQRDKFFFFTGERIINIDRHYNLSNPNVTKSQINQKSQLPIFVLGFENGNLFCSTDNMEN